MLSCDSFIILTLLHRFVKCFFRNFLKN